VTIYQVPMGQGVAVSPLQLAAAYAAIANDGVLVQPHLVKNGVQAWSRRVVSPAVAASLRGMLLVTVEEGTGKNARLAGYEVAGKTGTAQKPNEKKSGYSDQVIASFVGMVPAAAPRLVVLVMIDEPQTQHKGAQVAAPVFATITDFALKRLGIAPTPTMGEGPITAGSTTSDAEASDAGASIDGAGDGGATDEADSE
jgi:cell division protein FtsI (penicillin-binding protein 3)